MKNDISNKYAKLAWQALDDKKGGHISVIDIREVSTMGDYLVIADGDNPNHVQALCDSVEERLHAADAFLKNREGHANGGWILLDYCDIIVHIFTEESRSFYDLEHIWRDGTRLAAGDIQRL